MAVTLQQAKDHLRILHDDQDAMIVGLIEAAEDWMKSVGVAEENLGRPSVQQAALILIGHWFDAGSLVPDDGGQSAAAIPYATRLLIAPWRSVLI